MEESVALYPNIIEFQFGTALLVMGIVWCNMVHTVVAVILAKLDHITAVWHLHCGPLYS
jgi:hypothetical protein